MNLNKVLGPNVCSWILCLMSPSSAIKNSASSRALLLTAYMFARIRMPYIQPITNKTVSTAKQMVLTKKNISAWMRVFMA